ncbi:hypothetical protein [Massilia sp.]|uniref:hypothetical protein n=1 Tax=Massilia sp. TaxID=1882437 RepID=UPI0028999D29|nr:hypothetical protein [Massilia sp.]
MSNLDDFFSEALRASWVPGVTKVEVAKGGVDPWLATCDYTWVDATSTTVTLDISNSGESFARAFASEISRFSCATYESLLDATAAPHSTSALGWALIRYYYATFYAAHALLRLAGTSLTMITPKTAQTMNKVGGQYLTISPNVTSALYTVQHDNATKRVVLTKIGGSNGGSHEEMWQRFLDLLRETENYLILNYGQSKEAQAAVRELQALGDNLCKSGKKNGAWLSTVRNNLNYRHDYGVWFPCTVMPKSALTLANKMVEWKPTAKIANGTATSTELSIFIDSCNKTAKLLTSVLKEVSLRAPQPSKSFVSRQPFRLLRSRNVQL